MYRTVTLLLAVAAGLIAPSQLGAAEELVLFDGKDLSGWTCYLKDTDAPMQDVWRVQDGVLQCKGRPIGYLRTKKKYTNYVLKLQWRWPAGSTPGNGGVLLRAVGPDQVWPKSVEAQLAHGRAGDIWNIGQFPMKVDPQRTKGRRTVKAAPSNEKPPGEWNDCEIVLDGGKLLIKINGLVQNTATEVEQVAGAIALQSEGAAMEFRNIRLIPLDK